MTTTTKTTQATTPSKKDQIKTAIMDFLTKRIGSAGRIEIKAEFKDMGSDRTISRALAELKLEGKAIQNQDGKNTSWISTEPKTVEKKTDIKDPIKIPKNKKIEKIEKIETTGEKAEQIASDADRKLENAKQKERIATPTKDPKGQKGTKDLPKKPVTFLYEIKDSKIDPLACGACYHTILGYDETICPSCGVAINMNNTKSILQVAFNKLANLAPVKIHDLSKFKKDFLSGLIDTILFGRKQRPTRKNIADVRLMLETTDFLDKLKEKAKAEKAKAKKSTDKKDKKDKKKDQGKAGKITRNSTSKKKKDTKTLAKSTTKKAGKTSAKKGPGVIATIIDTISKKSHTKKQILAKLVKAFPDREADKMMKTINVQVPSRLRKDKELNIEKSDKGYLIIKK